MQMQMCHLDLTSYLLIISEKLIDAKTIYIFLFLMNTFYVTETPLLQTLMLLLQQKQQQQQKYRGNSRYCIV